MRLGSSKELENWHLAQNIGGHSGTISSEQLDIKNDFFSFFFVLYVDLKLSDDIFKKRKKKN
jgi:hypothetical protein